MRKHKKILTILGVILFIFVVLSLSFYFFVYTPAVQIKQRAEVVKQEATDLKSVFAQNDMDLLEKKFQHFKSTYQDFENTTKKVYWMSYVPFFGNYVKDLRRGVNAGMYFI